MTTSATTSTLVLEGGGLRGAFTAGVMGELARSRVPVFDDVLAVSSAAPTAAYYATRQADAALEIWSHHTHSAQLIAARNLLFGRPLMDIDRLVGVFQTRVVLDHAALATAPSRLWVGVTECATGAARYVRATPDNVFELLRAAMALPVANGRVIPIDGVLAIDGGVAAPVPIEHAQTLGGARTLVVLTRPRGYRRDANALVSSLIGWTYPRHPALRRAMSKLGHVSNRALEAIERLEDEGLIDVIRPTTPLPAKRLTRDKAIIDATIDCGVRAARAWLDQQRWW